MQADSNSLSSYSMIFVVFLGIAWLSLILFLVSLLSGWRKLSKRFRAQSETYGVTKSAGPFFYTVYLRYWSRYSSSIRITAADDALYLSVFILLRVGHPPLCIPWNEIQIGRTRYLWRSYVLLTLGNQERIPMRIPELMAKKLGIMDRLAAQK